MEIAAPGLTGGLPDRSDRAAGRVDVAAMFDAEAASLTRLARFYVDDKTAAEDLVQEAFIRFARHQGRVAAPPASPAGCPLGRRDRCGARRTDGRRPGPPGLAPPAA
jgi:hypothetical protein